MASQSIRNARELLSANLYEVFLVRDPDERCAAIERTYSEDVKFIDPDGEFVGWQALNDRAQELLDETPDSVFEEAGPRYVGTDTGALASRFGPPGDRAARWLDILTICDGRVVVCTLCSRRKRRRDRTPYPGGRTAGLTPNTTHIGHGHCPDGVDPIDSIGARSAPGRPFRARSRLINHQRAKAI